MVTTEQPLETEKAVFEDVPRQQHVADKANHHPHQDNVTGSADGLGAEAIGGQCLSVWQFGGTAPVQ